MEIRNPVLRFVVAFILVVGAIGAGVTFVAGLGFLTALVYPWLHTFRDGYIFLDYILMGIVTLMALVVATWIFGLVMSVGNDLFGPRNRG
jgi:hypothetical protein